MSCGCEGRKKGRCVKCFNERQKIYMRAHRAKIKKELEESNIVSYHLSKKCPHCKGPLEMSRYFSCLKCMPILEEDEVDYEVME